ncbi:MAG: mannose-1-phosphate guanylyltransferase [Patescibacteria group bacterium]|jgi:mannose-1-phosphate guanylyltransferase
MTENSYLDHLYVVILCGGGGTRVWPLSVTKKPKQFLNFYSDKTLYQETLERAKKLTSLERIIVVTNRIYTKEIAVQSPEIPKANVIAEPQKKNTAMAMGAAAAFIKKIDPDAVVVNLASDHVVSDMDIYLKTLKTAAKVAYEEKKLVAIGIEPTYPHPGFGYIRIGEKIRDIEGLELSAVAGFREKPDVKTAEQYLKSGSYLWNANFYTWRVDAILDAFDCFSPTIARHIHNLEKAFGSDTEEKVMEEEYRLVPEEPIDTAISEKADNLVVLPGKFRWNDIGSWEVVYDLGEKDNNGNVVVKNHDSNGETPVVMYDSNNNLVYCNNQPLGILGLNNLVIVDTGVGILVCDRKRSNEVKKIVDELKQKKMEKYL